MRFTRRRLNRTLLLRQHLLERVDSTPAAMVAHLVGLQAQESMPPYLSLAARLRAFDPREVSDALEQRTMARILSLRDTVHLHLPGDALTVPVWAAPVRDREPADEPDDRHGARGGPRRVRRRRAHRARRRAAAPACARGGADRALPGVHRGAGSARWPGSPRSWSSLPPRGCWKPEGSTAVAYDFAERWLGAPLGTPDVPDLVRRYLRAFGPATAADVTTWSGITRLVPVLKAMDDLVRHEGPDGKPLYDVEGAPVAEEDTPAPVRLLGTYDNVWLSHAGRDRVTEPERRTTWMGVSGARANALFADGWLEGLWRVEDGKVVLGEILRPLSRRERGEARRGGRPGRGAARPLSLSRPSGPCGRALRRRRPPRRWRCAAPRCPVVRRPRRPPRSRSPRPR
ncbi:winged helix DNA-binding domain-containing protein [Nocardioides sp. W3-2-3]|nr:winged helix DNA-binding domain-containing protein [Nocardioides convexus]